jgi:glycosyltransferase involved in cell wall biosynthesis
MHLPTISIVTPSFNQARFIVQTARSVFLQRYPRLEYVMMDGGSTDGTSAALEPYRQRFHHYVSAKDGGQADAIRRGFEHTTGEIMAYLNSDDVLAPGSLNFVAAYFQAHPRVDAIYSHRIIVNENNVVIGYWILPRHRSRLMMRWDLIPQETCFWRRRLYDKVGGVDASYRFAMDYDLFTRFMLHGRMRRVKRFLGAFRMHSDSKSVQQLETIGKEEIQRVGETYGIRYSRFDKLRGPMFTSSVRARAAFHARSGRTLPGALGGTGYDYDDVWGGMLRDTRMLAGE